MFDLSTGIQRRLAKGKLCTEISRVNIRGC
jgi:hypothetical protein